MKRINFLVGVTLAVSVVLCLLGSRMLSAQDNLKSGTVVQRTELKGAPGWEAILVQRILPPGAESGKHTQSGNEIVYIQEGSVIFEAQGKPAVTLKPGEAFTTAAGPGSPVSMLLSNSTTCFFRSLVLASFGEVGA